MELLGRQCHLIAITAVISLVVAMPARAQDQQRLAQNGLAVTVASQFAYDDNVLRQQTDQIGSRVWQLNPKVRYQFQTSGGTYYLNYDLNHMEYLDSSQDTVTNQILSGGVEERLNSSNKFTIDGSYNHGYEARGVGFNEAANALSLDRPTLLTISEIDGKYQLGRDNHGLRFTASVGHRSTKRDSPLIVDDSRNYNENYYGLMLQYRVASRTDLAVEYRHEEVSYPRTPTAADGTQTPLDSADEQYLIGADLEATAKTTGKVRVGFSSRHFGWKSAQWADASTAQTSSTAPATTTTTTTLPTDSDNAMFWEFAAVWAPLSYSRFEFSARTSERESLGVGSFVSSKDYSLIWTHQWSNRTRSRFDFTFGTDDYHDTARVDDRKMYNLRMEYDFNKVVNLGFGLSYQTMKSSFARAEFDKSIYYVFLNYRNR